MKQLTCPHCGKTFEKLYPKQVYCSVRCRKNADKKRNPSYKLVCSDCGATFKTNNKDAKTPRCPSCREKWHAENEARKAAKAEQKSEMASVIAAHEWRELEDRPGFSVSENGLLLNMSKNIVLKYRESGNQMGAFFGPRDKREWITQEVAARAFVNGSYEASKLTKEEIAARAAAADKPSQQAQYDETDAKVLEAWNSGLNAKQIREKHNLGENTVMRHLHAAGIFPQQLVEERAAQKRAIEEAERIAREAFRDLKGEQLALFPKVCPTCGTPIPLGSRATYCCEECKPSAYKAKKTSELTCCDCGTTYYYEKGVSSLTRCENCHAEHQREIRRQNKWYGNSLNTRGKRWTDITGAKYQYLNPAIIFERDNMTCYICHAELSYEGGMYNPLYPTVDHVVALSVGGDHTYDNTRACCRDCNSYKGDKPLEEVTFCA